MWRIHWGNTNHEASSPLFCDLTYLHLYNIILYSCLFVCMSVCASVRLSVCMCVWVRVSVWKLNMCMSVCVCICMYACMHLCTHVCTYVHMCTVPEITFHHTGVHQIQLFHCYNYLAVLPVKYHHRWRHSSRVCKWSYNSTTNHYPQFMTLQVLRLCFKIKPRAVLYVCTGMIKDRIL